MQLFKKINKRYHQKNNYGKIIIFYLEMRIAIQITLIMNNSKIQ